MLQNNGGSGEKYIRMMNRACAAKTANGSHMKFGIEVPKSFKDALRIDSVNGNKLWEETIKTELKQINSYNTFKDHGMNNPLLRTSREFLYTLCLMSSLT